MAHASADASGKMKGTHVQIEDSASRTWSGDLRLLKLCAVWEDAIDHASDTLRDQFVKRRYMDEWSQATGMRFWKITREGVKRDQGVGRSGEGRRELEVSRIGRWDALVDFDSEEARGLYRSDVFRLRTGPTPETGTSSELERGGTGRRERSAHASGLVISGDVSKEAIQGMSLNACGWGVSRHSRVGRRLERRRLGINFGRPWEEIVG